MIRSCIVSTGAVMTAVIGMAMASEKVAALPVSGFVKPVEGAVISQGFGCTSYTAEIVDVHCPGGHWHSGVDLAIAMGAPIHATAAGSVTVIHDIGGYGLHVIIDHGDGISSLYGHMSAVTVTTGDVVAADDVIGAVGSTGNSSGPHLHFEIRRNGIPEDPRDDLALP